ncbi:Dolichol phosphate-mannose biosynthesis regulatory protein [Pseudozyma hubeiensis]|nr:Dolichol phosphate-mannose biosynthesis regulatory protein [Pseudozyma hubeiensis]
MSQYREQVQIQGANRTLGNLILLLTSILFGTYTVWSIILPFLPDDVVASIAWIPDRKWAITVPSLVLVLGLSTVGIYAGMLLRADALQQLAEPQTGVLKKQR